METRVRNIKTVEHSPFRIRYTFIRPRGKKAYGTHSLFSKSEMHDRDSIAQSLRETRRYLMRNIIELENGLCLS
jgi:hypothetical protein